jgi:phage FluMu protein Com
MSYLRCPDCRLTAHATAYYIQGDRCPRCLTVMEPAERFREKPRVAPAAVAAVEEARPDPAAPPAR